MKLAVVAVAVFFAVVAVASVLAVALLEEADDAHDDAWADDEESPDAWADDEVQS